MTTDVNSSTMTATDVSAPGDALPGARSGSPAETPAAAAGRRRRWHRLRGPALLYALLACIMLTPFAPSRFRDAGDLYSVIGGIVEARNAFIERQFPIRVPPHALDGVRYPIFQFYGNAPFTAGGLVYTVLPVDPYFAWKLTVAIMLTTGALFTYLLAKRWTRRARAAVLAGVLFMTSPYMFTDIVARGAYTEFFAFCLLPVVLYLAWRAYVTPGVRYVALSAIAWALLGMSHNITYMYGVVFFGLLFLMLTAGQVLAGGRRRPGGLGKQARRLGRVVAGGVVHLALVAWYVAPQLTVVKDLVITARFTTPQGWAHLTTLETLLKPFAYTPLSSSTPNLTLQVGPPVLFGVALALLAALLPRTAWRDRRRIAFLLLLFVATFVLVWSPFDVWAYLPRQLGFVQFPYRLMMFLVVFGSLLTAYGVGLLLMPRPGVGRRRATAARWVLLLLLAGVGVFAGTYLPRSGTFSAGLVPKQLAEPLMGGLEDYQFVTEVLAPNGAFHPELNFAEPEWALAGREFLPVDRYLIRRPADVWVPTPLSAKGLRVEGILPPESDAADVVVLLGDTRHVERLKAPGPFAFSMPVSFPLGGKPVRLDAYAIAPEEGEHIVDVRISKLMFESPDLGGAEPGALLLGKDLRPKVRYDRRTKLRVDLDRPTRVQIPVLYYPKLLTVRDNGRAVSYGNLGRFVALELPAGPHRIDVAFTGVGWANWVSAIGWAGVLLLLAFGWVTRRQRRRASIRRVSFAAPAGAMVAGSPEGDASRGRAGAVAIPADPSRFGPADALAGCAAVVLGGLAAEAAFRAARFAGRDVTVSFVADRPAAAAEELALKHAFDGSLTTAWAAAGSSPVALTLEPSSPAALERIQLFARETSLYEAWRRVHVVLSLEGRVVLDREVRFQRAHLDSVQSIELPPTRVDRIQLRFSDPVVLTPANKRLSETVVNPGYREIRLHWAKQ